MRVSREEQAIHADSCLGRSLRHLADFIDGVQSSRTDLYVHQRGIDRTSAAGKANSGVFGEFELAMIQKHVNVELARTNANGCRVGRPSVRAQTLAATKAI